MAKKERPEYEALVNRIASGELTRQQAADIAHEQTGLSKGTFLVWLSSSGASERLKEQRGSAGDNSVHSHAKNDPDKAEAYENAILAVINGTPGAHAARMYAVNYQYLMRKVTNVRARTQGLEGKAYTDKLLDEARSGYPKTPTEAEDAFSRYPRALKELQDSPLKPSYLGLPKELLDKYFTGDESVGSLRNNPKWIAANAELARIQNLEPVRKAALEVARAEKALKIAQLNLEMLTIENIDPTPVAFDNAPTKGTENSVKSESGVSTNPETIWGLGGIPTAKDDQPVRKVLVVVDRDHLSKVSNTQPTATAEDVDGGQATHRRP